MKKPLKSCLTVLLAVFLLMPSLLRVSAAVPTDSYSHWNDNELDTHKTIYGHSVYDYRQTIDARSIGLTTGFNEINDICTDESGNTYILDSARSRILILDSDYRLLKDFSSVLMDGSSTAFEKAQGIYADNAGNLYICDTEQARVLVVDAGGTVKKSLTLPDADIIPGSFKYRPIAVTIDKNGYIYVLSDGSYYGAMVYSPEGEFLSFFGANSVSSGVLSAISGIFDKLFNTDAKTEASSKKIPYQFVDLYCNNSSYIYTVTGSTNGQSVNGQIKMLSPGGSNILYRQSGDSAESAEEINFVETDKLKRNNTTIFQNLCCICVDSGNYIYGLDSALGKGYIYDAQCNLIGIFGGGAGSGAQDGTFVNATSMALKGDCVLVADQTAKSITVFERNDFGTKLMDAQTLTLKAKYDEAKPLWEEILRSDRNSQQAYVGLGKAAYQSGDYSAAMTYSKQGLDRQTYNMAYTAMRNQFIEKNFLWLFLVVLVAIAALVALMVFTLKHKVRIIRNEKLHTMSRTILHPFDTMNDIKYKNLGSVPIATVLVVLWYITSFLTQTKAGFLFSTFDSEKYNSLFTLAQTLGLIAIFCLCNWAMSGLFSGKGKLSQVFIASAYSLLPLILYRILFLILSQSLSLSDAMFLHALNVIALIACGFILCVGLMVVHDFDFFHVLGTMICTVLAMILLVFVLFMVGILIQEFCNFITTLITEVAYR